jgi:hypothetical protein
MLIKKLGIDPEREGRHAITTGHQGSVWDYISLKRYQTSNFTSSPHATFSLRPEFILNSITVPNNLKGGIKKRIIDGGIELFKATVENVCINLEDITSLDEGIRPVLALEQRHYKSQRSNAIHDGMIKVDLRAIVGDHNSAVKYQPMWLESIYNILINKKTNIQLSLQVRFPYSSECMRNEQAAETLAETWIRLKPFLDYIGD